VGGTLDGTVKIRKSKKEGGGGAGKGGHEAKEREGRVGCYGLKNPGRCSTERGRQKKKKKGWKRISKLTVVKD